MSEIELKQRLHELHDELEKASKLTTEERDVLGHLMTEMVEIAQAEEVPDASDDLQDRVERYAGDFENQHSLSPISWGPRIRRNLAPEPRRIKGNRLDPGHDCPSLLCVLRLTSGGGKAA